MPWRFDAAAFRAARLNAAVGRQPPWVLKLAVAGAVIVMLAVLAVLIVPAAIVFGAVLLAGAAWGGLRRGLARVLPDPAGRRNVRVIARREEAP